MKKGVKKLLFSGSFFIFLSLALLFLQGESSIPKNVLFSIIKHVLLVIGFIKIFEASTLQFYNRSLIKEIFTNKKNLLTFVSISVVGAIILELVIHWAGKLWIYPGWNLPFYFLIFIPGFAFYWLFIAESYLGIKALIDHLKKGKKFVTKSFKWEKQFFNILGVVGIIILALSLFFFVTHFSGQSQTFFDVEDLSLKTVNYVLPFYIILPFFLGSWLLLEFVQFKKNKPSFLKDTFHGYFTPLITIIFGSILAGIVMEAHNIFYNLWIYINWPLEHLSIFGLPIIMIIVWPLQYIAFLSLWRAFSSQQSEEVWKGDLIK